MAITRRGQLFADTQSLTEFVQPAVDAPAVSTTKVMTGSHSYRFLNDNPVGLQIASTSQLRAGVWCNHLGVSTGRVILFRLTRTAGGSGHYVTWDNDTHMVELRFNNVNVATIPVDQIGFNVYDHWQHLGLTFKAANPGFFTFYLNGVQALSYTGDTSGDIDRIYFGGKFGLGDAWVNFAYFDDFYVDDAVGELDASPPPHRFVFSVPSGAGADTSWTPNTGSNFAAVDEAPPDDDTTYVAAAAAALKDTYNFTNITLPPATEIMAAIAQGSVKKSASGTDSKLKFHLFDGSIYASGSEQSTTTSYATYWERFTAQPDTTAWDLTDFNTMQAGYESAGAF